MTESIFSNQLRAVLNLQEQFLALRQKHETLKNTPLREPSPLITVDPEVIEAGGEDTEETLPGYSFREDYGETREERDRATAYAFDRAVDAQVRLAEETGVLRGIFKVVAQDSHY